MTDESSNVNYKYGIGDRFGVEILGLITDENGEPAYKTNYGAVRETDLEVLPRIRKVEKTEGDEAGTENSVFPYDYMLVVTKAYEESYEEHSFFHNWLDAYKEMFTSVIQDFPAPMVEQEMKSGRIKVDQYSAHVHRDEGKFIYRIIKLVDEEDDNAEG